MSSTLRVERVVARSIADMSVVRINAIEVPEGMGEMLEERFAKRLGAVDGQPGFEGFELLRPDR